MAGRTGGNRVKVQNLQVIKVLADREDGKGFARQVLADERLKGKTFNGVNATLAAAVAKGLCTKAKAVFEDKMLTCYTITELGREVVERNSHGSC